MTENFSSCPHRGKATNIIWGWHLVVRLGTELNLALKSSALMMIIIGTGH